MDAALAKNLPRRSRDHNGFTTDGLRIKDNVLKNEYNTGWRGSTIAPLPEGRVLETSCVRMTHR